VDEAFFVILALLVPPLGASAFDDLLTRHFAGTADRPGQRSGS